MEITIRLNRKDVSELLGTIGRLGTMVLLDLLKPEPQTKPKPAEAKKLDENLLAAISEAFVTDILEDTEETFEENQIIKSIQILKKDNELFKDVSNVVLMFHMMSLGFERVCISRPDVPPIFGYYISPSKDLLIALEEDAKKKAT